MYAKARCRKAFFVVELMRTNDPVVLGLARSVLEEAGCLVMVADNHMSVLEGSIGVFPRRLLVHRYEAGEARSLLEEAGLAAWLLAP